MRLQQLEAENLRSENELTRQNEDTVQIEVAGSLMIKAIKQ